MVEMSRAGRIMAASRRAAADLLPFFHYWRHSQVGWAERACRNRGMGFCWVRPCYVETMHGVEVTQQQAVSSGRSVVRRTYTTPVGSVYTEEIHDAGTGQWHAQRSWRDISPWQTKRLIVEPEDYAVVQWMVEHTEYTPDYFPVEQAMDWLGDDGLVLTSTPHSPFQTLMIDWIGSEGGRFYYHHADYPELVESLSEALCASRRPMHEIAACSPAPIVMCGDNVDGFLVTPPLFERYFMPVYEEQAAALHAHGKLMAVHMDGRLNVLKHLITRTPIDIVEALHPPPMGDLPIGEALDMWPDKAIWVGYPSSVYAQGPAETRTFALELLRGAAHGADRLVIEVSTENLVSNENLVALTDVLSQAELPLTSQRLVEIARTL